jgi:hypothetical protein
MKKKKIIEGANEAQQAEAELYRLAQAEAMLRLFKQEKGYAARNIRELEAWVASASKKKFAPSKEDIKQVEQEHPELVQRANQIRSRLN